MTPILHLDFETFSLSDISEVGAYRYANDPSTEILCAAMALDDRNPVVWDRLHDVKAYAADSKALLVWEEYWDAFEDPSVIIWAHNAQFEMAIAQALLEKTWQIKCPDLSRWRCTANLARRAALPHNLEKLAETLGLTAQKDKRGKSLMRRFSVIQHGKAKKPSKKNPHGVAAPPDYRILPQDDPEAFAEFMQYCQQDVRVEQEVFRKLSYFAGGINDETWMLDSKINARGVPVNIGGLEKAQKIIEEESEIVFAEFRSLTGVNPTQGAKLKAWLEEQGATLYNLQAATITEWLEEHPEDCPARRALQMKQDTAYASIGKVPTMLECAGPYDNRVRGMLTHHGATTGRWTNGFVQFQNMKRPTIKHSEDAYREICEGLSREMVACCYGPPLEVISSCVRHFVHDSKNDWIGEKCTKCKGLGECDQTEGLQPYDYWTGCPACGGTGDAYGLIDRPMLDADYAAIEARIISWLAGQEDALQQYRAYDAAKTPEEQKELDPYRILAAVIYGIPLSEVQKTPHRLVGKHARLGCGYGMGAPKFRGTVKHLSGYDLPEGLEETAVKVYRDTNRAIVRFWYALENAAKDAILNKGKICRPTPKPLRNERFSTPMPKFQSIQFLCQDIEGMPFLLCKLPSGRKLAYPRPRVVPSRKFETGTSIVFFGLIKGKLWGEIDTYGGSIAENITQGVAFDVMANGAMNAESKGYEIATLIHDEALAYYYPERGQTVEEFKTCLTGLPQWGNGLPVAVEGGVVPFYRKD